ncbi:hypothetical protein [uncultured Tenacibaculum sp.]|uniref:hypothetical protein n=1 Tax=uncultured Tenacibaculum sp. TaxID=174713 RepID=UPI002611C00A|nr:hypothetical protein [uncultured Tenacibaculum sp.]
MKDLNIEINPTIEIILKHEIKYGNSISEISKGWQKKNSILIILEKPFSKKYTIEGLEYRHINDPHYWKEEYSDKMSMQTIACKF